MDAGQTRVFANDWLKDFSLALKNVGLYSADHPRGREYLERSYDSLRRILGERREVILARTEGRLYLDQILLDRDRALSQQLSEDLAARGVDCLVVCSTITPEEHLGLIRCLMTKPDRITEKGGFGRILLDEGISSVKANAERVARSRDAVDAGLLGEVGLIDFLLHMGRSAGGPHGEVSDGTAPSVSSILARDAAALGRAIQTAARSREPAPAGPEGVAEILADTLERLAERAIEEHQRDREEILADIGRAAVASDPEVHPALFIEKAGPRSIRKNLAAAVEALPPGAIADLVAIHYPRAGADPKRLNEILNRINAWRDDRASALAAVEARLQPLGVEAAALRDFLDHLLWGEVSLERRLELLSRGEYLWRAEFARVKEALAKLFAIGQIKEATALIQKYLSGLLNESLEVRRLVADNARYILQLIEKAGKGGSMLGRITDLFFARLQDEQDADVVARLAGGLAFLADLRMKSGDLGAALELMRKAEQLGASPVPELKERGDKLAEALSRAGNDKMFRSLTEKLLEGSDQASMEAAEILKRGGSRSTNYLIERLAEEENRSHRARLVMLMKEMGKGSSMPFISRLNDPRWFLVRNVVGILGDIGDVNILPHLKKVASHGDPRVRREMVRTYMRLGTPECEDLIIAGLVDEDRGVQITAVNALATLKGRRAVEVLTDLARRSGAFESTASEVRQEALISLGRLGAKEAFPIMAGILSRKGFLGHAESTELRVAAARALGYLGTPEAVALLKELAQKDPRQPVREAAQEGLQQCASSASAAQPPR